MSQKIIKKDTILINAAYTLTLAEQRLILLAVADANGQPDLLKDMTVHASDYAARFGVTRQGAYMALAEATSQLFERKFSYERISSKGRPRQVISRWVQRIEYGDSEGLVKIRFADDVIPLLTDLKKRFTSYALEQVADLTSVHAMRLYELLIAWRNSRKTPVFELNEFRQKLGIADDEYPRMDNFKRRVLDASIEQINKHTDIVASYEQHKKGRTITGFSFTFKLKNSAVQAFEANKSKSKRKVISKAEAEALARPGESWTELLDRLKSNYWIKDLNPKKPEDPEA